MAVTLFLLRRMLPHVDWVSFVLMLCPKKEMLLCVLFQDNLIIFYSVFFAY